MNMPNTYKPTNEHSRLEAAMGAARMAFPILKNQMARERLHILIQRYNRIRLQRVLRKLTEKSGKA